MSAGRGGVEAARMLGSRALEEHREESARIAIARLPASVRADAVVQHILGLLHRAQSDLAPALAAFDRALVVRPNDPRLVHARARATAEAGLDAATWFTRARALAPGDGDVILGQAGFLALSGHPDTADALLAEMLQTHPGWMPGHWALIQMRYAAGDPLWLALLDAAIAGAPRDDRLHHMKVRALLRARRDAATLAALAAAQDVLGATPAVRALTATVESELGQIDAADAAFRALDPLATPELALAWFRHLLRRGEPDRVAALADRIDAPTRHLAWPYLSAAWRLLGDPRAGWLDDPRLVRVVDLALSSRELADLAETLRGLHVAQGQPLDQSVRGGTQTEGPLLSRLDPPIVAIRDRLRAAVDDYVAALPAAVPGHPLLGRIPPEPRFEGSWSVRLTAGGHHEAHVHTHGWLSSACYVALPGDGDDAGALALGSPQATLGLALPPLMTVTPAAGRLVLFPSTLWHETLPFPAGERLTIAFDIA